MSEMQIAGKKRDRQCTALHCKFNPWAEESREKKHVFFPDTVKCFDKL